MAAASEAAENQEMARALVASANELAQSFYELMMGCKVADSYLFNEATHPKERLCWAMACEACKQIAGVDPEDALTEI